MMHAIGMGLDWFYEVMSPAQRVNATNAIVEHGLYRMYQAVVPGSNGTGLWPPTWASAFVNTSSNWNTVIFGGAIIGCLAGEHRPEFRPDPFND